MTRRRQNTTTTGSTAIHATVSAAKRRVHKAGLTTWLTTWLLAELTVKRRVTGAAVRVLCLLFDILRGVHAGRRGRQRLHHVDPIEETTAGSIVPVNVTLRVRVRMSGLCMLLLLLLLAVGGIL